MTRTLIAIPDRIFSWIEPASTPVLTTLARLVFAATLLLYFWSSGLTKIPDGVSGLVSPTFNAYVQIFPKAAEASGFDITTATFFQKAIILAGTWAEFILPAFIVFGLFTRAAAFGMIGFITVQSLTDVFGHGADLGALFDRTSEAAIDQRAFWVFVLLYLVFNGGGPFSLDRFLLRSETSPYQVDPRLSRI